MSGVALVPDLMDQSKVRAAAPGIAFVRSVAALLDQAVAGEVAVVDLSRPGAPDAVPALVDRGARVVAFGSHVDADVLRAASEAGATAMPRSRFFTHLAEALGP